MKEKIMQWFKGVGGWIKSFFKDKTIAYYVALGFAVLTIVTAIIYTVNFAQTKYMSWAAFVFLLIAAIAFIALSVFGYNRIGSGAMSALSFTAFLLFIASVYTYFLDNVMIGFKGPIFTGIIVCAALMLVCSIGANVTAWLHLKKKAKVDNNAAKETQTETQSDVATETQPDAAKEN